MSIEHGEYDSGQQMWYCGYWMTEDEWLDVHDYAPAQRNQETGDAESEEE